MWRDGLWAFGAPLFFLVATFLLGLGPWPIALGIANILTLLFTSLTVGGVLFGRWRADIETAAHVRLDTIREDASERHRKSVPKWHVWRRVTYSTQEMAEIKKIGEALRENSRVHERVEFATFFLFMAAAISGGFAIAAEVREMPALCWQQCAPGWVW